jgi:hypothetical protein
MLDELRTRGGITTATGTRVATAAGVAHVEDPAMSPDAPTHSPNATSEETP